MKLFFRIILILYPFSAVLYGQSFSQENPRQLIVNTSAQLEKAADRVYIDFSVIGYGPNLRKAVENAVFKTDQIAIKLYTIGLNKSSFSTSSFTSGENIRGKAFLSSSKDYRAIMRVRITLDSLKLLSETVFCLSESDISDISNIQYILKDYEAAKIQSREKAIENAKVKAKQMADLGGFTIKRVLYMSEDRPMFSKDMASSMLSMDGTPTYNAFFEKTITITSYLYVIFEIE